MRQKNFTLELNLWLPSSSNFMVAVILWLPLLHVAAIELSEFGELLNLGDFHQDDSDNTLPVVCTWENVRDRFRDFGDVQSTDMKGRGVALIRFSNERDAARAVDRMRGSRFYNRVLDVSLY